MVSTAENAEHVTVTNEQELKDAIDGFGKLVGRKDHASPTVFYAWQKLKVLLDEVLEAFATGGLSLIGPAEETFPTEPRCTCIPPFFAADCRELGRCIYKRDD